MVPLCGVLRWHFLKLPALSPTVTLLVSHSSLMPRSLLSGWRRSFSSQPGSLLLDLPQYRQMRETLAGRKDSLGVLESAGLFILDMEKLRVNATILNLNLLSKNSIVRSTGPHSKEIKKLKAAEVIKIGKYTSLHDELILSSFHDLSRWIEADHNTFRTELFSPGRRETSVLLQRNLLGFYLLQKLEDWSQRLPVEVVDRLGTLLSPGFFTRQEDKAILAWVEEHGLTGWAELAAKLSRNYKEAGACVRIRHQVLKDRQENKRMGSFSMEETALVIREVIKQKPSAMEDTKHGDIDWRPIAESLNRPDTSVYQLFRNMIHPTVRRHLAGTLEQDVRAQLVLAVGREGWTYSTEVDFSLLAGRPQFQGHTHRSLERLYNTLMGNVMEKQPALKSMRDVTVEDVEDYWRTSTRRSKRKSLVERELGIIKAYQAVVRELNKV